MDEPNTIYTSFLSRTLLNNQYVKAVLDLFPTRIVFFCLVFLFASFSCKDSPSASDNTKVTLTFEDASCIETWLRLKIENATPPYSVALSRDGNTLATLNIFSSDTLLIDEGLAPSTTYTYRASLTLDNNIVVQSPDAPARTMDTTSHNWIFDPPVLLGDGSSSVLYDVAIINDTLAYAVGEIYKQDSLGNWDPNAYNLVKWDGMSWTIQRVTVNFRGNPITPALLGIYAFSANDIWFTAGMAIHGDGVNWIGYDVRLLTGYDTLSFTKCWGSSTSDMYFVGLRGSLAHYDGTRWTRMESGTTAPINDVWGGNNLFVGESVVLAAASNRLMQGDIRLIRLQSNGNVDSIQWGMTLRRLRSVWFNEKSALYVCGDGIFSYWGNGTWRELQLPLILTNSIRGNSPADIFVAGDFGFLAHFNGITTKVYDELSLPGGIYKSLSFRGNKVFVVGFDGGRAIVLRGER